MTTAEAVKCACGTQMEDNGLGAFICPNCDVPQEQESAGFARRKTRSDIRFDLHWDSVIDRDYEDNTKKKGSKDEPDKTGGTENG